MLTEAKPITSFEDIEFKQPINNTNNYHALLYYGKYHLSIVKHDYSYGGKSGLWEIGVFDEKNDNMVELLGITNTGDTVKGYLTNENITGIIRKMETLTRTTGLQIPI